MADNFILDLDRNSHKLECQNIAKSVHSVSTWITSFKQFRRVENPWNLVLYSFYYNEDVANPFMFLFETGLRSNPHKASYNAKSTSQINQFSLFFLAFIFLRQKVHWTFKTLVSHWKNIPRQDSQILCNIELFIS